MGTCFKHSWNAPAIIPNLFFKCRNLKLSHFHEPILDDLHGDSYVIALVFSQFQFFKVIFDLFADFSLPRKPDWCCLPSHGADPDILRDQPGSYSLFSKSVSSIVQITRSLNQVEARADLKCSYYYSKMLAFS